MKKTILTIIFMISLNACKSVDNKKELATDSVSISKKLTADDLLLTLNECHKNPQCKEGLDSQLPNWLLEKSYTTVDEPVVTDEHDNKQLPKNVTVQNKLVLAKVNLSSNYMNNELIRGALNEWLTWKRPQLINTWQYYQYMRKEMILAFNHYKIDEALILAIMAQESGGKVHSRSRAGAGGLFQLMPATAKRLGLHGKEGSYDLRFNPGRSALAAAKYIDEQSKAYDGDEAKILAAYNSGENRFKRLNKKYKNKPLWDKNFYYELPQETRHYVPVVIAAMLIFQNPDKFNVILEPLNTNVILVNLPIKTSLSELAVCLGQEQRGDGWFRILRNLNSGVKADNFIKANENIKIPAVLADTFNTNCKNKDLMQLAQSFHDADFQGTNGVFNYRVKKGDSLGKIARKFRCTNRKEIARMNRLKAPRYLIRAGKYLKIPQC